MNAHRPRLWMTTAMLCFVGSAVAEVPRAPDGRPSLEGTWDFKTATPYERPEQFKDKEFLTPEEVAEIEAGIAARVEAGANVDFDEAAKNTGEQSDVDVGYNSFFLDFGTKLSKSGRTSLVVDPPNGRLPAPSAESISRYVTARDTWAQPPRGPEDRNVYDRCIKGFNAGPPMTSGAYNNVMQIVQSPDHVVLHVEMVNDHRVIPTNGSGELPEHMRLWNGNSVGVWEGDTFVVTTTNFNEHQMFRLTGPDMKLTERFTRIDEDTLEYRYTVEDSFAYPQPFTVVHEFNRIAGDVLEYACHEGNYAMSLMLKGARKQEEDGTAAEDDTWLPTWSKPREVADADEDGE